MVARALTRAHGWAADAVRIVTIKTTGDRVQDRALAEIGGKALWTKELDRALLDGETDCSVHSMKDVETFRPDEPDDRGDAEARRYARPADRRRQPRRLAKGATVGTSSPRRRAQLLRARPGPEYRAAPRQRRHATGGGRQRIGSTPLCWRRRGLTGWGATKGPLSICCPPRRKARWASKCGRATRARAIW